jgi:hypothetical protein
VSIRACALLFTHKFRGFRTRAFVSQTTRWCLSFCSVASLRNIIYNAPAARARLFNEQVRLPPSVL